MTLEADAPSVSVRATRSTEKFARQREIIKHPVCVRATGAGSPVAGWGSKVAKKRIFFVCVCVCAEVQLHHNVAVVFLKLK